MKKCNNCNCRIMQKSSFCIQCGQYVEKKFNEPLPWLGWETY